MTDALITYDLKFQEEQAAKMTAVLQMPVIETYQAYMMPKQVKELEFKGFNLKENKETGSTISQEKLAIKERVLANIAESKAAREASRFREYVTKKRVSVNIAKSKAAREASRFSEYVKTEKAIPQGAGNTGAKGLIGHGFEDYLTKQIGGNGSFSVGGRDFDGGIGNRWWKAKSGNYWKMLEENPKQLLKFKDSMGDRLKIAKTNGATYEIFSNTPIPESIKQWLTKKGIPYTELLD